MTYSAYQLDLLNKMGVDVWVRRANQTEKMDDSVEDEVSKNSQKSNEDSAALSFSDCDAKIEHTPNQLGESTVTTLAPDHASLPGEAVFEAKDGGSLGHLKVMVERCQRCELHASRNNVVFGNGNAQAEWMFVGEAPGQQEDLQGNPFVGRAGKLLDLMIRALGMKREDVYVANVLKCRPPNNRDPLPSEVEECENYLKHQLALVKPKVVVALGRISAQALLKSTMPLGKMRGGKYFYGDQQIPLVITYHPAYLLRSPDQKAKAWEDLWFAKQLVERAKH